MAAEWLTSAILIAVLTNRLRALRDSPALVGTRCPLAHIPHGYRPDGQLAGRPWAFIWIAGLPPSGAAFRVIWCRRNGINPLTAEPRDRYEQLRSR
jgi:hypothetical protein